MISLFLMNALFIPMAVRVDIPFHYCAMQPVHMAHISSQVLGIFDFFRKTCKHFLKLPEAFFHTNSQRIQIAEIQRFQSIGLVKVIVIISAHWSDWTTFTAIWRNRIGTLLFLEPFDMWVFNYRTMQVFQSKAIPIKLLFRVWWHFIVLDSKSLHENCKTINYELQSKYCGCGTVANFMFYFTDLYLLPILRWIDRFNLFSIKLDRKPMILVETVWAI